MIGKAIALYALWRAWRGRKDWPPEPSLLELQDSLNVLRALQRDAAERHLGFVAARFIRADEGWELEPLAPRETWL